MSICRRILFLVFSLICLGVFPAFPAGKDPQANLVLTGFAPYEGSIGTKVLFTGSNLSQVRGVLFGGVPASFEFIDLPPFTKPQQPILSAIVPRFAASGPITLATTSGEVLSHWHFEVVPQVVRETRLTGFAPFFGQAGDLVVLTGYKLPTIDNLFFSGSVAAPFRRLDNSTVLTLVPPGAQDGPISVSNSRSEMTLTTKRPFSLGEPMILNFFAYPEHITKGSTSMLYVEFTGGSATLEPEKLQVFSGQAIPVQPSETTEYTLTVEGPTGLAMSSTLQIQVHDLLLTPGTLADGTQGIPYTRTFLCQGGFAPYLYAISEGTLPTGLSLDPETGILSGSPSAAGSFEFTVQVTDALGLQVSQSYRTTIWPLPVIENFQALPHAIRPGESSILSGSFSGGTGVISNGVGELASPFLRTVQPAVTTTFVLSVTNPAGTTVQANAIVELFSPGLGPDTLANGTVSASYAQQLLTTGGTAPFVYEVSAGMLPPGLALSGSGELSGTPTHVGNFSFTATSMDANQLSVSRNYTITILPPVLITAFSAQPGTIQFGQSTQLMASFSGGNGVVQPAVGTIYPGIPVTISPASTTSYTLTVTNSQGVNASSTITVQVAPGITTQPQAVTVTEGQTASFSVVAGGTAPLTYQWYQDGTPIPGAESSTCTFATELADNGTQISVVVTNAIGFQTSANALLTVNPNNGAPIIASHPQSQTVTVPDTATFTVVATGSGLEYQWTLDGSNIGGAIGASHTTPATQLDLSKSTYTYQVQVTNLSGSVNSNPAVLTVQQPDPVYAGDPTRTSGPTLATWEYATNYSPRGAFRLAYDEGLRNPLWSAYCTYKIAVPIVYDNDRNYRADVRSTSQVGDSDFSNTGYTRGHTSLFSDLGRRYGTPAADQTCITANLCPQVADHNNNLWNQFEQAVSGEYSGGVWTKPGLIWATNRMWIYTGPTFSATPNRVGPKSLAVPNGFWKVMVKEVAGVPKLLAVLTPHEPVPPMNDYPKYVTTLARIEELTGLNLFPGLSLTVPVSFRTDADVRGWGAPFEEAAKPNVHIIVPSWNISASVGEAITFQGQATSSNSSITSTDWNFGNGQTASGNSATYTYLANGTYNVVFTATDALGVSNTLTRVVTVTGGNEAPTVSSIANQTTRIDTAKVVNFTVNDDRTAVDSLVLDATSNNQTVLPNGQIVLGGTGTNRTLTLTPAAGQTGTATVTLNVTDGDAATTVRTFTLTVNANSAPTISAISAQSTPPDTPKAVNFTVGDDFTPLNSLVLGATSDNQTLVPDGNLVLSGSDANRTLTITPASGQTGSANITITATDSDLASTPRTFALTVSAGGGSGILIISQYYEGASNDKYIEITNVGTSDADLSGIYIAALNNLKADNPVGQTPDSAVLLTSGLPGGQTTLAAGQSIVYKNSAAAAPAYAVAIGVTNAAVSFSGDDITILTTTTNTTAWENRLDVIGNGTTWGSNISFVRKPGNRPAANVADRIFNAADWNSVPYTDVNTATSGTTNYLGFHQD